MAEAFWNEFYKDYLKRARKDPFSQVGRTLNSEPMSVEMFQESVEHYKGFLALEDDHKVLDLCCGNGLLSAEIAKDCSLVIGVDFSQDLIDSIEGVDSNNLVGVVGNVLEIGFKQRSFDRVLVAAALQHFSESESITLFRRIFNWLGPDGRLVLTDIPDRNRIWNFFNTEERISSYYQATLEGNSALGTWYDRKWLENLAIDCGFTAASSFDQPEQYWYSHYRFDIVIYK